MSIVKDRKVTLCENIRNEPVDGIAVACPSCDEYYLAHCCCDRNKRPNMQPRCQRCHHYLMFFTDGACTNNGRPDARAGAGVTFGNEKRSRFSIAITDRQDNAPVRSNQRAELFAAIFGVEKAMEMAEGSHEYSEALEELDGWLLATDSEYVVKGITEWLPTWKLNGMRNSRGTRPVNLDLFLRLDAAVSEYEAKGYKIGFWHIRREDNGIADHLAKVAARFGNLATPSS